MLLSKLELIPGGGFRPSDKSITEHYKHRKDGISGHWQCLVLVGWAGTFVCRLEWNKTSGCYLQPQSTVESQYSNEHTGDNCVALSQLSWLNNNVM